MVFHNFFKTKPHSFKLLNNLLNVVLALFAPFMETSLNGLVFQAIEIVGVLTNFVNRSRFVYTLNIFLIFELRMLEVYNVSLVWWTYFLLRNV